jgi:hypothetical protein
MSNASMQVAAILFIAIPTIEFGGVSLLRYITRRYPGYMDNPTRRALFTAGHAHAGVLVILALIGMLYVDNAQLSGGMREVVRWGLVLPPILMPLGFFLSIVRPSATHPNRLIALVYLGAASLVVGTLSLGVGLLRAL